MVEATKPGFTPVMALEEAGAGVSVELDVEAASVVVEATSVAATADSEEELVEDVAPRVTVTKVVWIHPVAATATEEDATDDTATDAATEEAATSPELPAAGAAPTVPSTALVVKFEKP
jgi:hypothetical protein